MLSSLFALIVLRPGHAHNQLFRFHAGSDDVIVLSNTISFDAHVLQVMPPLFLGATMVIARPKGHMDPDYMARLIIENSVTSMIFTVPTLVRARFARTMIIPLFAFDCFCG